MTNKPIKNFNKKSIKNKRTLAVIITIVIVLLVSVGIIFYSKTKTSIITPYKITYYDELTPGSRYSIKIQNNNKIKITTTHFCSTSNCKPITEKETFNYSKDNQRKIKEFINNNFSNNYVKVYDSELTDRQKEVIQSLLLGEYFFETNVEEYKYKIEYSKNNNLTYDIYFKNENSILVKKLNINNQHDIVSIDTYPLNFSEKSKNILNDYIEKQVKKENSNIIYKNSNLQRDEINIFNSITEKDESYLNNIEYEAKLSYTIHYDGINCPTPILYLYNDNTYEYYDTFSMDNDELIPKTGTYNYDIKAIINNIDKYKEDNFGPYIIEENQKSYTTYKTNIELQNFLKKINIDLDKCLEEQ